MRISLLDPGLSVRGGHHLEWTLRLLDELLQLGHEVQVYVSAGIDGATKLEMSSRTRPTPLFRVGPYASARDIDPISGELVLFLEGAAILAEDLRRVAESDLWIWPSLFAPQLHASSLVAPAVPIAGCIHVDPTFMAIHGRMWWRYAFRHAQHAKLRFNIGVTGPLLQQEYAPLTATGRIECFPVAHDGTPPEGRKTALKTIGFFGYQRQNKGVALLPALVPRLLRDGFQIVVHDSAGIVQAEPMAGLTVLGYVRSLAEELARCDLIVVPYDPATYRLMGSGIVWDAIASGVPVVVPAGTAPWLLVESCGAGRAIRTLSVEEVYRCILEVQSDYDRISSAAFEASRNWRNTQGVKRLAAVMVGDLTRPA